MRLYFLPASESGLNNSMFHKKPRYRGGVSNHDFWIRLAEACARRGIELQTFEFWNEADARRDDALLVQNHPGETLFWRIFYFLKHGSHSFLFRKRDFIFGSFLKFRRRTLLQGESPMVVPYIYRNLTRIRASGIYQKIFLLSRRGHFYGYFNYFDYRGDDFLAPTFTTPKEKFLTMINTNATPHSLRNEFYGERLRAIRYFSTIPGFDLWGYGWNRMPRHPFYLHYGRYVKPAYRGEVEDKVAKLSEYRFTLCFENCAYPGYVSEKIFDCLAAGTVPIYLGAQDITSMVPADCFIDFRNFFTNGRADYGKLERHLRSLTDVDLRNYRAAAKHFVLNARRKSVDSFIDEVVGNPRYS